MKKVSEDLFPSRVVFDRRTRTRPQVSFLVPVYDERAHVASLLQRLQGLPLPKEILVVDDGSTDGTRDLLNALEGEDVLLVFHARNGGKGRAVRTALGYAKGDYVAIQDADLEYDPAEYVQLLETLRQKNAEAVYGSRFLIPNPNLYKRYLWGNRILTGFLNLLCGGHFTDSYTCYKLMGRALLRDLDLRSTGFEMEAEISVKIAMRGIRYVECPIHYRPRRIEEGKKINSRDALKGFWTILSLWWAERKRRPVVTGSA